MRDSWQELLKHDAAGQVCSGSVDDLAEAFSQGRSIKVGISGLCDDLSSAGQSMQHEVFVEIGSAYYYLEQKLFIAGSHPIIRVKPGIPMNYESKGWDFGWLVLRTDGKIAYRRCDPYTLVFNDSQKQCAIRWFVR